MRKSAELFKNCRFLHEFEGETPCAEIKLRFFKKQLFFEFYLKKLAISTINILQFKKNNVKVNG